jgi:hypothetical protein
MKNRESVLRQLTKLESGTQKLNFIIKQQQPIEDYLKVLEEMREAIDQARLYVESEPMTYNQ